MTIRAGLCISEISDLKSLKQVCEGQKVFLYGAGVRALSIWGILKHRDILVSGFLVSTREGNALVKNGCPVIQADGFNVPGSIVLFAIDVKDKDKCHEIVAPNIDKVFFMEDPLYTSEFRTYFYGKLSEEFTGQGYKIFDGGAVEKYFLLCQYEGFFFRASAAAVMKGDIHKLKRKFDGSAPDLLFKECYGGFHYLPSEKKGKGICLKTYAVYMARCHVDHEIPMVTMPAWIIPIQTGAALTDKSICAVKDNQGDNISGRNRDYSECTALYWMWKNAPKADYVGLCHYRRHFDIPDDDISVIECNGYDIITTVPTAVVNGHEYFREFVTEEDICVLKESIRVLFQDYCPSVEQYLSNSFCPPCNMVIMRYDIFMGYAEYVFCVTERIHNHYSGSNRVRNDRYMGYLVEMLMGIFFIKNSSRYKIGYTNMKFLG